MVFDAPTVIRPSGVTDSARDISPSSTNPRLWITPSAVCLKASKIEEPGNELNVPTVSEPSSEVSVAYDTSPGKTPKIAIPRAAVHLNAILEKSDESFDTPTTTFPSSEIPKAFELSPPAKVPRLFVPSASLWMVA